ncbi:methyl-accepting chemotaxis protein [Baekduia sp.]|jgi:methyl-accepting chemotaxis protein|uniref:methyl-accepting chemotaxis protein n=1 Tax=Baekduia sp. TaxID=2600305 RepID=UPI002DF7C056|nr:methyl-accepting chemotaxis protein [Baekduia sp.]
MHRFALTIGRKLALAFGLVIALTLVALAVAMSGTTKLRDSTQAVGDDVVPAVHLTGQATTEIRQFRVAELERTLATDPAEQQSLDGELIATATTVDGVLARLNRYAMSSREAAALQRTKADWLTYRRMSGTFTAAAARGGAVAGYAVLAGKADRVYDRVTTDITASGVLTAARGTHEVEVAKADARTTRRNLLIALLAALAIGAAAAVLLTRSIRRSVAEVLSRLSSLRDHCATDLNAGLHAFAAGDLTHKVETVTPPIPDPGADEIGDIARATNDIRDNFVAMIESYNASRAALGELVGEVAGTASAVSTASEQMATTSDDAGRAISEIADAVGDAAAGAELQVRTIAEARRLADEVVSVTGRSADDAASTARVAEEARVLAGQGAKAVDGATAAMASVREASAGATDAIRALGTKSAEIGGIVDTITGIARQTNLLALNAAIEAARAGEQGRGFAVVADEVRKLAEESQTAAATIAGLIGDIQDETAHAVDVVEDGARRTREGSAVVEDAREAFERIGGSVEDVTVRVGAIAAAVEQIASSARDMGERMSEVAAVAEQASASSQQIGASTEQTSASTQEIAASAHELARTAASLDALVARFTLARD